MYMLWVPTEHTVNHEYYVEVLKEFRKRFRPKRPALFKSGQWHFPAGQYTGPQLHPCLRLFDQDVHPSYSPDLAPCDSWLFPKLKEKLTGRRYETIEEMKEAVRKVSDILTEEDFHGSCEKLLER